MKSAIFCIFAILTAILAIPTPQAKAQSDDIVGTGARISSFESNTIPYIHLKRKPDFIIQEIFIESDSRSKTLRLEEINKTMLALVAEAKKIPKLN